MYQNNSSEQEYDVFGPEQEYDVFGPISVWGAKVDKMPTSVAPSYLAI